MQVYVHTQNTVTICRAEVLEVSVLERMIDVKTRVVRTVVPVPVIVLHVLILIHVPAFIVFHFPSRFRFRAFLGCRRDLASVRSRRDSACRSLATLMAAMLGKRGQCRD